MEKKYSLFIGVGSAIELLFFQLSGASGGVTTLFLSQMG